MIHPRIKIFLNLKYTALFFLGLIFFISCDSKKVIIPTTAQKIIPIKEEVISKSLIIAADNSASYLFKLKQHRVALVTNSSGVIQVGDHTEAIVDYLLKEQIAVKKVFVPEHGFRGEADAGEKINNSIDTKTGLPIISLYGKNRKPNITDLKDIDIVLFDLQDVGVRFYTYISTLHYVMEACAEQGKKIILLDRPNPNANYIDGPVLKPHFKSFVGLHPVPVVYGMTIGEYAQMINGEGWLKNGIKADLEIIPLQNYTHEMTYALPIKPSPNLPNIESIYLYPSLCFFEGTNVSVGRGTDFPFQVYGAPYFESNFSFTPESKIGASNPPYKGILVKAVDLRYELHKPQQLNLRFLIDAYLRSLIAKNKKFWNDDNYINLLAGTDELKKQINAGMSAEEIRNTWQTDIEKFKLIREKYLLYP